MNKIFCIILFLSAFVPDSLVAQYYKPNGAIDDEKIILELKKYDSDYVAQDSVADFFVRWILSERMNGELAKRSEVIKNVASGTAQQIGSRRGKYEFLSMDFRNWRDVPRNEVGRDTVDSRISLLEKTWDRYLDSIQVVSRELFDIANNIRVTREGRDQAARLLGRTNDPEMMDYIFKNDRHYRFGGFIDDPYSWEDCWGCNRSALGGLVFDKITRYQNNYGGEEPKIRNWSLFPLFIKYWGDSDYDLYVQTVPYSGDALEAMAFIKLVENYKMPWLVYEFLVANAVDPNTRILKLLGKLYLDEKEYYESRHPIPTEK